MRGWCCDGDTLEGSEAVFMKAMELQQAPEAFETSLPRDSNALVKWTRCS